MRAIGVPPLYRKHAFFALLTRTSHDVGLLVRVFFIALCPKEG